MEKEPHMDIDALIAKELSGELSVAEKEQLNAWIAQSDENATYAKEMREVWSLLPSEDIWTPNQEEVEQAWSLVQEQTISKPKVFHLNKWIGVAASIALVISVLWLISRQDTSPENLIANSTDTPIKVDLPDGSVVVLQENSQLSYPSTFEEDSRAVKLTGSAHFNVEGNKDWPFKINTGSSVVEVLGTEFFVHQQADSVYVAVDEGVVALYEKDKDKTDQSAIKITKGKEAFTSKTSAPKIIEYEEETQEILRQDLLFDANTMEQVIKEIENLYNVTVNVENEAFYACTFSAKFTQSSLEEVLESLSLVFEVNIEHRENTVTISGEGC